jgi:hypothetical protein
MELLAAMLLLAALLLVLPAQEQHWDQRGLWAACAEGAH